MAEDNEGRQAVFDSIGSKIKDNTERLKGRGSYQQFSIYKVPEKLRNLNEGAYAPRVVSIGPLHKDKERLVDMESQKAIYMDSLFRRIAKESNEGDRAYRQVLENCIDSMLQMEARARACYAASVERIRNLDFAEMMVVDGCFIIEHLYRSLEGYKNSTDPIFGNPLVWLDVRHDLLLLENQIPLFVLQNLFQLTVETIQHGPEKLRRLSLTDFIFQFFGNMMNSASPITKRDVTGDHILGLLHNCYLPSPKTKDSAPKHDKVGRDRDLEANGENQDMKCNTSCWFSRLCGLKCKTSFSFAQLSGDGSQEDRGIFKYTATELDLAGVNFYAAKKEQIMEVEFSTSCWFSCLCGDRRPSEIPTVCTYDPTRSCCCSFSWLCNMCGRTRFSITPICIYDSTESFLRNLIAFEQCSPRIGRHITSYAFLMDTLIDNEKDVELLEKARVLQNHLGASEDALKLFNNLCNEVVLADQFSFKKEWNQVDKYCNRYWPRNIASLRQKYFSNPWAFISLIAALYAFGLSIYSLVNTIRTS